MKRLILSALVAVSAIGGVFATQTVKVSKPATIVFENPGCNSISCSSSNPVAQDCEELTLFADQDCNEPTTAQGFRLDIEL